MKDFEVQGTTPVVPGDPETEQHRNGGGSALNSATQETRDPGNVSGTDPDGRIALISMQPSATALNNRRSLFRR